MGTLVSEKKTLAFTDPGTVLDHFLVVYFIRKHFFPGEIGPDSAERAGFRLYFRKCARGLFPGLAKKFREIDSWPDFFFFKVRKQAGNSKTQLLVLLLAKKGLNAIKLCINRVHSGPRPSNIVPPRSFVARGNKYLGPWAHLLTRLTYNHYYIEAFS